MSEDGPVDEGHSVSDTHGPAGTPVPMPVARFDAPHLGDLAKNPVRTERSIALVLLLGIAGVAGFGAAYWENADQWFLALTFGIGLFGLGFGMTAWGKYLMPQGPFVEERHTLASSDAERESMAAALVERSGIVVKRRKLLGGLLGGGMGIFGIVALFPLLRSLGPLPKTSLETTDWKKGTRLVDSNFRPVHRNDLVEGGIMTVYPENPKGKKHVTTDTIQSVDQTVLIRFATERFTTVAGRESWTPTGYIAFSKVCTHLGCPVGLYEKELGLLVCPCHQSMFTVADGAVPKFGPAPRPLPQLPLAIDSEGYLVAQAGYDQAVGPGFWERTDKGNGTA